MPAVRVNASSPILILGMHRSGTSCLTGSLQEAGLHLGEVVTQARFNLKGNRENLPTRALNDEVLALNHASWDLPPARLEWTSQLEQTRDRLISSYQASGKRWGFKDPRTLLTLPFWMCSGVNFQCVGAFRHPWSVAQSLLARDPKILMEDALELWYRYNSKLLAHHQRSPFPLVNFSVRSPEYRSQLVSLVKVLQLGTSEASYDPRFFSASLRHQSLDDLDQENVPEKYLALYQALEQCRADDVNPDANRPVMSVVANFYNMQREAPRTLWTLSDAYQTGIAAHEYEVIVVENGSSQPLKEENVLGHGTHFSYNYLESESVSPCAALNHAVSMARGDYVVLMIDGARMLSPNVLGLMKRAIQRNPRCLAYTLVFHLGQEVQSISIHSGYNQDVEDQLLASIDWKKNGYDLFNIATLGGSSAGGYSEISNESGCFMVKKSDFERVGGYDERFVSPGGGLASIDLFRRLRQLDEVEPAVLMGEGTFHQFHGGAMSGAVARSETFKAFAAEYKAIRGEPIEERRVPFAKVGTINEQSRRFLLDPTQG